MPLLSGRKVPGLGGKSKSEWFVVSKYMVLATFHKVAEMADGKVDGQ